MRYFTLITLAAITCFCVTGCKKETTQPGLAKIAADENSIFIETNGDGQIVEIIELKPYQKLATSGQPLPTVWQGKLENTTIEIPRFENQRDRLYSKFQTVDAQTLQPVGPTLWVTDLSKLDVPATDFNWRKDSIKGLTCIVDANQAKELGVKFSTDNLYLPDLIDWNGESKITWNVDGKDIHINPGYLEKLDYQVKSQSDAGINVTMVLNNPCDDNRPPTPLIHPLTDPANAPMGLCAFNLANEEGYIYYRAIMEFLANRYSDPNSGRGLVSGYVVGNELEAHWVWYNMGPVDHETLIAEYMPALRVTYLAVKKYNKNIRFYVSMDHHWHKYQSTPTKSIPGDDFLERVNAASKAEGDFPWLVAFHPYPENLFHPDFWNDQVCPLAYDAPKISFKNIEVLKAFLDKPHMQFEGQTRHVIFSEQGLHCPPGEDEKLQAAAYTLAYYKTKNLGIVDAFMLHRHQDHPDEGGLLQGVISFDVPPKKKFIYDIFKQADTPQWREAFEFAKPIIGIDDWSPDLICTDYSDFDKKTWGESAADKNLIFDFVKNLESASLDNSLDWRPELTVKNGIYNEAIFHHPPQDGVGKATFTIDIPTLPNGKKLTLKFATGFLEQSDDGAIFTILINDEQLFSEKQIEKFPKEHSIDVTRFAGRKVTLTFQVDKIENLGKDWALWISPRIVTE